MTVKRFGVSLEDDYLDRLDTFVEAYQYPNRSQALRMLIDRFIFEENCKDDELSIATLTLIVKDNISEIIARISKLLHSLTTEMLLVNQVAIGNNSVFLSIVLRGKVRKLKNIAERVQDINEGGTLKIQIHLLK